MPQYIQTVRTHHSEKLFLSIYRLANKNPHVSPGGEMLIESEQLFMRVEITLRRVFDNLSRKCFSAPNDGEQIQRRDHSSLLKQTEESVLRLEISRSRSKKYGRAMERAQLLSSSLRLFFLDKFSLLFSYPLTRRSDGKFLKACHRCSPRYIKNRVFFLMRANSEEVENNYCCY